MAYKISEISHSKIDDVYKKAMKELDDFFELDWKDNCPHLILVPDRKTIDSLRWEKTEPWVVGWATRGNVYVLLDSNFETESNHKYSDEEYFALIKHELAHCFSNIVSNSSGKPVWLLEGISIFLSGQNAFKSRPGKIDKFLEFYDKWGSGVYIESGFVVEFLIKNYGKSKLLSLLRGLKKANSKETFSELFKSIYEFELTYDSFVLS